MQQVKKSVYLFRHHVRNYRRIQLHPLGFTQDNYGKDNPGKSLANLVDWQAQGRFFFEPKHFGQKEPVRCAINEKPYFNLKKIRSSFPGGYFFAGWESSPLGHLTAQISQGLETGPLLGREFLMYSTLWDEQIENLVAYAGTKILIKIQGGRVPGLNLFPTTLAQQAGGWRAFIPPGPDRDEIEKALAEENKDLEPRKFVFQAKKYRKAAFQRLLEAEDV